MSFADENLISKSVEQWCELAENAERTGDYLGACDAALMGLEQHNASRQLQFKSILNLSRAGARRRAIQLWHHYRLDDACQHSETSASLDGEIAALGARLDREEAFGSPPSERPARLHAAARRYDAIYRESGSAFPGINAAVLYQLAGHTKDAAGIARQILEASERAHPATKDDAYQLEADKAAANLILRREGPALAAVETAARLAVKASSIASTRRQLLHLCDNLGISREILAPLKTRSVVYYSGSPNLDPPASADDAAAWREWITCQIDAELAGRSVGYGYGSLGNDGEIAAAEALVRSAAETTIVLPFEDRSFLANSPSAHRFYERSRELGHSAWLRTMQATDGSVESDPQVSLYAKRLAMGLAILRADHLCADIVRLSMSEGPAVAADAADADWERRGLPTSQVRIDGPAAAAAPRSAAAPKASASRKIRFIIFGDFENFSRLQDAQMLTFYDVVMPRVAAVVDRYDGHLLARNTWGDGLHLVLDDIAAAAQCALEIQADLATLVLTDVGLPATLGLRLALDAGAVFEVADPVLKTMVFTGAHICRTARIEPGTPPGEVYVTETFAALLSLSQDRNLTCDYVGSMRAAKNYGRVRTYLLRRV